MLVRKPPKAREDLPRRMRGNCLELKTVRAFNGHSGNLVIHEALESSKENGDLREEGLTPH